MAETRLVVEHREQLWSLLIEAAQIEHMIMCQYLYACFSLRTEPDEGLTAGQADAVARWQGALTGIAIEEMLHLALVNNVMTAIGARRRWRGRTSRATPEGARRRPARGPFRSCRTRTAGTRQS